MTVFSFRVTLQRFPDVSRVIECDERHTLHQLHREIQGAFNWDDDHLYAFYLGKDEDDRRYEYVCPRTEYRPNPFRPTPQPKRAEKAVIGTLSLVPGRKFRYIFDFGDQWRHGIEVTGIDTARNLDQPMITARNGDAPSQYHWFEDVEELVDSGDRELMKEELGPRYTLVEEWEIMRHEDLAEVVETAAELAARLLTAFRPDKFEFDGIDDYFEHELCLWILGIPDALVDAGKIDEALAFCDDWAELTDGESLLQRAEILAGHGRRDEAGKQIAANLARCPHDVWVSVKSGDAYKLLGDTQTAEAEYRRALDTADEWEKDDALQRLLPLLRETDRADEADRIEDEHQPSADDPEEFAALPNSDKIVTPVSQPYVRTNSKVGRNEPCPCGSGKKFKKCCGR